jgi:hypothetical protein
VGIQIDLRAQEIAALKQATQIDDDAAAVARAARDFLRLNGLRELKAASGNVEFDANRQELEELERGELDTP